MISETALVLSILLVIAVVTVSILVFNRLGNVNQTLEDQKKAFSTQELSAKRLLVGLDAPNMVGIGSTYRSLQVGGDAWIQKNAGIVGNLGVGSNLGVLGGVTSESLSSKGSIVAGSDITTKGKLSGSSLEIANAGTFGSLEVTNTGLFGSITSKGDIEGKSLQAMRVIAESASLSNLNVSNVTASETANIKTGTFDKMAAKSLNVSGESTFGNISGNTGNIKTGTFDKLGAKALNVSGDSTFGNISGNTSRFTNLTGTSLNISGDISGNTGKFGNLTAGSMNVTGTGSFNDINAKGRLTTNDVNTKSLNVTGDINARGKLTTNDISAGNIAARGKMTTNDINTNSMNVAGVGSFNDINAKGRLTTNDISAGNITTRGKMTTNDINTNMMYVKNNMTIDANSRFNNTVTYGKYAKFEDKTDFYGRLCMRNNNTDVCLTGSDMAKLVKLSQAAPPPTTTAPPPTTTAPLPTTTAPPPAPTIIRSFKGLIISHPDGRTVKNNKNTLQLNTGTAVTFDIYNNPAVFNNKNGRVAFLQGGDMSKALRHFGNVIYSNPFSGNSFDFAWHIRANGSGFDIYNDYGGGLYLGYDAQSDSLKLVPLAQKVTWRISPLPPANLVF